MVLGDTAEDWDQHFQRGISVVIIPPTQEERTDQSEAGTGVKVKSDSIVTFVRVKMGKNRKGKKDFVIFAVKAAIK